MIWSTSYVHCQAQRHRFTFQFLFVSENTQSLDCFKCGLKESDNVICEDFDPGAVEYKEKCSNDVLSCIKVFGTYDNITGR